MKMYRILISIVFTVMGSSVAHAETTLATYTCTVPSKIEDPSQGVSGVRVELEKRQQGDKIYFVYRENIYPSFDVSDQGVFEDIGIPWGRTRDGIVLSVKDKNIFLSGRDNLLVVEAKSLLLNRATLQDFSICTLK